MALKNKNNQTGAVSLLTVIFIAILLTLITLSFLRLSITEHRQSVDQDLTTRAYYAAESGVEDAKRALTKYLSGQPVNLNGNTCDPADVVSSGVLSTDLQAEYTCQYIDLAPNAYERDLNAWETAQIPLRPQNGAGYNIVKIFWHPKDPNNSVNLRSSSNLPSINNWHYPAMLRVNLFSTPNSGSLNRNSMHAAAAFLNPASSGTNSVGVVSNFDRKLLNTHCNTSVPDGAYVCEMDLSLGGNFSSSSHNNYLRIQSLYVGTTIKVELYNSGNGNTINIEDVQAVVDVTGRANDVFRRVQARVSLLAHDPYPFPDYAIMTAEDICKNFSITDDPADFTSINPGIGNTSCAW